MKRFLIATLLSIIFMFTVADTSIVSAGTGSSAIEGGLCDFLPCDQSIDPGTSPQATLFNILRFVGSLIFIVIIVLGIWQVIKGAGKIMRSEGDTTALEEGAGTLKGVWIGIAMIVVGIVGVVIVFAFFGASGIFNTPINEPSGTNIENL